MNHVAQASRNRNNPCAPAAVRGLISASQMHRNRTSAQYKYSCPRFWACTRCWRTPAIFHVPFSAARKTREETRYLGEQARYSPKRNCPDKEARSRRREVSGSSLKRRRFLRLREPSIVVHYPIAAYESVHGDVTAEIELTRERVGIAESPYRLFNATATLIYRR